MTADRRDGGRDIGEVPTVGYGHRDPGGLEEIETDDCWALLRSQPVGRFAVIAGPYPLVFPVNYAVDRRHILFRTGAGTKLWAVHHSNVTFQVDQIDPEHRSGWSVMAWGAAHEISEEEHVGVVDRAAPAVAVPWAPGERGHTVRMVVDGISGRRIRPPEETPTGAGA
jgi:nitroimidazol reductase NimA-like FMN-containing flavoprotein (pyridoxamine 5'-phosphate oxidase superfamily)